jgi:CxxC-x17-CxxC domain-containing protein
MFPAICSTCGKATQVPFEPRLDKPVYCSDCFTPRERSYGGSGGSRRY